MKRRDFIQALSALASTGALPSFAAQTEGEAFDAAVADKPWLKAFKGVDDATQDLHCESLALSGRWPAGLRGRFYRNGPGLFERGGQRYRHWFDGDGMVQQFTFTGRAVSHRGRLVRTPKLLAEQRAGRFLYSAFGTSVRSESPAQGPDSFNTANTNAIEHAGRVLAMWKAARPSRSTLKISPPSARYVEGRLAAGAVLGAPEDRPSDGHLWNIGTSGDRIIAWHVDAQGRLVDAQVGASPYPNGMVHDMAITARHLVVPLPPVKLDFSRVVAGDALEQAFTFQAQEPLRILVMSKDDITQRRVFELPAQFVFHVGNAYERADGNIALTFIGPKDHRSLIHGAPAFMSGRRRVARSGTQSVVLDMRSGRASVEALGDTVEFPRIDPRRIGLPARHLLTASSWVSHPGREARCSTASNCAICKAESCNATTTARTWSSKSTSSCRSRASSTSSTPGWSARRSTRGARSRSSTYSMRVA